MASCDQQFGDRVLLDRYRRTQDRVPFDSGSDYHAWLPFSEGVTMSERETLSAWRKSSFSANGACIEWRCAENYVYVRDSKDPSGGVLKFTCPEWRAFVAGVKAGEADLVQNAE